MERRIVLAMLAGWMLLGLPGLARAQAADPRPNLILAIADDWGYPHAGAYGYKAAKTPTFDRLAGEGMLFTRAYCAAPSCTASRGSILTGQAPHRLEQGGNLWSHLPAKFAVYPNLLEKAGYVVGARQKAWGPGRVIDRPRPPAGPDFKSFEQFLKTVPADKPFCFWLGSHDPHRPYVRAFSKKSGIDPKDVEVPPYLPDTPEVRLDIVDYLAEVQRFDSDVAEMLAVLKKSGRENTLIIVTGDNGWPWPHGKANLYDPGVHQPFAAWWPEKIKAGTKTDELVSLTDIAPTFLAAAGVQIPNDMTGVNLLPVLLDQPHTRRRAVYVERERHARAREGNVGYPSRAVVTDDYLFIRNFEPNRWPAGDPDYTSGVQGAFGDIDNGPTKQQLLKNRDDPAFTKFFHLDTDKRPAVELYDLKKDPNCLNDVAQNSEMADKRKTLSNDLADWMKRTADPRAANPHDDRWDEYPYYGDQAKKK
jgi:arylsulfatase A-like enzyme